MDAMTRQSPYASAPRDLYGPPQPHEWQHRAGAAPYDAVPPRQWPHPYRPGPLRPPDHDRQAFVAPLIASVLGGPVIVFCGMIALISPMLLVAPGVLLLAVLSLGLSWLLPRRLRYRGPRAVAAVAALLLAATTLMLYFHLPAAG
jgi:hypothetical protein